MTDALNKIKARIRALSEKTIDRGCTEAEAVSAMNMVSRLLEEYNLNMAECDLKEVGTLQKKFKFTQGVQYVGGSLLASIARFCSVKVWFSGSVITTGTVNRVSGTLRQKRVVDGCVFFGFEQDVQMAEYLYNTLNSAVHNEIQNYKKHADYINAIVARKSLTTSFEHGMNNRLCNRLDVLKHSMDKSVKTSDKNQLVVIKDKIVETDFQNIGLKLKTTNESVTIRSGNAYNCGQKAGDRVNINRPIESENNQMCLT